METVSNRAHCTEDDKDEQIRILIERVKELESEKEHFLELGRNNGRLADQK